ncbi:hypothetical protein BDY19DRAFT_991822 [Irpex rosettiformis]|uniref:Uncharacterized protein n=1 Tax=Irpex rosettiformis TaxID=378272 RepID=A0ACB8UAI5_9APHY|nr:hypothetical protein BDY19DRAFT_991822 [Irpex rosettiformis]
MVYPRLQHLLATLLPSLFFTLTDTADPVFVFSVAGLVVALVVSLFPLCLMVSVYETLAFYYPRVIIFYIPSSIVHSMNTFPTVLANPSFLALYASVMMVARPLVFRYLEGMMAERNLRPQIIARASQCAQARQAIADQKLKLRRAIESCTATEMEMHELESERSRLEENLERIERMVTEVQGRSERHKRNIQEHEEDIQSLRLQVSSFEHRIQQQIETAYNRKCEEARAARKACFAALATAHRREEHRTFVDAKKNDQFKARLSSAIQDRESAAAAYCADVDHWRQQQATYEAQYIDLQGSLEFTTAEHRIHLEQCKKDRELAQEQLTEQNTRLDSTRKAHVTQLCELRRLHDFEMSSLKSKNDLLTDRLTSASDSRDTTAASFEAHVDHTEKQMSAYEAQYSALAGSLEFAATEHRIHIEHCEGERAKGKSRIKELLDLLSVERAARTELQAEHNELKSRHALTSEGYADTEAKLKIVECELYLEKQRHHSAIITYRASQDVSDTLIDSLVLQRRPRGQSLLRTLVARSMTQAKSPAKKKESEPYLNQIIQTLPPSTLFDKSWLLPQPDFVEGSSSDWSFSVGSIMATSTPHRPSQECIAHSRSESTLSDMSLSSTLDSDGQHRHDHEVSQLNLLSGSTQFIHPSPSDSDSILTRSDMSLASIVETPPRLRLQLPGPLPSVESFYPSPPPSGSTATLDLEPSLPPPPSEFVQDSTAGSLGDGLSLEFGETVATSTPKSGPSTLLSDLGPLFSPPPKSSGEDGHILNFSDEWSVSSAKATSTPFVRRTTKSYLNQDSRVSESLVTSRSSIMLRVSEVFKRDSE